MVKPTFVSFLTAACLGAAGCVSIETGEAPDPPLEGLRPALIAGLDPGSKTLSSLHFEVQAYSFETTRSVSEYAERLYVRIMTDTGLDSFRPRELYKIVIYGSQEEYHRKTGLPEWSAGASDGISIYAFEGPQMNWVLPHEMTHLIFSEYMGIRASDNKWLNEGLAVFQEQQAAPTPSPSRFGSGPIPFLAMVTLVPLSEKDRDVSAWYHQVGSVVRMMIERSSGPGFQMFLRAIRDGKTINEALQIGYPGKWRDLQALEDSWRGGR